MTFVKYKPKIEALNPIILKILIFQNNMLSKFFIWNFIYQKKLIFNNKRSFFFK